MKFVFSAILHSFPICIDALKSLKLRHQWTTLISGTWFITYASGCVRSRSRIDETHFGLTVTSAKFISSSVRSEKRSFNAASMLIAIFESDTSGIIVVCVHHFNRMVWRMRSITVNLSDVSCSIHCVEYFKYVDSVDWLCVCKFVQFKHCHIMLVFYQLIWILENYI